MALTQPDVAFVWMWLPDEVDPVVVGRLDQDGPVATFTYARSYLRDDRRIAVYQPELELRSGPQAPEFMSLAGCIADGGPDAWGRRVVETRLLGTNISTDVDLNDLTYLLESASDRIGALDFQPSPTEYQPRGGGPASLDELLTIADSVAAGISIPDDLGRALWHGTAIGGARPKALLHDGDRSLIAKFSTSTDDFPNVKGEFVAMSLARRAGLEVASVEIALAAGRDVLLVERFDRPGDGRRRAMVSARTMLRLTESGLGASYADLANVVRARFTAPENTLHELFGRMAYNVLCGNTDDHARNHAAFWDGSALTLTPGYDISPEQRPTWESNQAMAITADGQKASRLTVCLQAAASFQLTEAEARAMIDAQIAVIEDGWGDTCAEAGLSEADADRLRRRQFLHPYVLEGY